MAKVKDNLKNKRKAVSDLQGISHRLSADVSTETSQARRECQDLFKVMKSKGLQPRRLHPARLRLESKGRDKERRDARRERPVETGWAPRGMLTRGVNLGKDCTSPGSLGLPWDFATEVPCR